MKTFRLGGIHPHAEKHFSQGHEIEAIASPKEYTLLLSQHIGSPAKCVVKAGETVFAGQMVAQAAGFVSAPVHTPVAGKVKKLDKVRDAMGFWQDAVIITAEEAMVENAGGTPSPEATVEPASEPQTPGEIVRRVGDCGVVGLGGATFPTRVKLTVPEGKHADFVLINGAECEPYLTCDDQLMRQRSREIISGVQLLMQAVGVSKAYVGIEENKPEAIDAMKAEASASGCDIEVVTLKKKYPQGGEKQLINAITGRVVPASGLPIDAGCIVDNVATAYAVYQAVALSRPLTERVVTVTGPDVRRPGNYLVRIGTPIIDVIEAAGGLPDDTGKVLAGGPMMGRAVSELSAPVTKGLSGLTILPRSQSWRRPEQTCIRCMRCVDACPMGLQPYLLGTLGKLHLAEESRDQGVMNCIECGSCTWVCPSSRPLVDYIKLAKQLVRSLPRE